MNGMLSIVQSITAGNCLEQLPQMLAMLDEHQSFRLKPHYELEPIVSHISNLLNDSATKLQGLLLLNSFLPQCPLDIFEQKGSLWITLSTKVLVQKKPQNTVCLALRVLSKLLRKSVHIPELTKAISNTLLSKIIESIRLLPASNHGDALVLLEEALSLYPGAAGITKINTEKFLLSFVDVDHAVTVKQSARCLHLLQQTRGGGTQSAAHKIAWSNLQLALIGSLHELLDGIYSSTSELVDSFGGTERLLLPDLVLSDEPVVRTVQLVTRFKNLVTYLQVALLESFPVAKAIQPSKILGLIARGLAVNCDTLGSNAILDNIVVGSLLPVIHIKLLDLLQALISSIRTNMLTYREIVSQLVLQSLKWTSSGRSAGTQRPFTNIRIAAYRTLNVWCQATSYASGVELCIDDLIEQILQDVTPFQNEVTLKVMSGATKHMSKKARRNMNRAQNDTTNLAQTHANASNAHNVKLVLSEEGNQLLCAVALKCLAVVVLVSGTFLKPVMHKLLQEHIVKQSIQMVTTTQSKTQLYGLAECRSLLYRLLHVLVTAAHHLSPPPLQFAVEVLSIGAVRDASPNVRKDCVQFVRSLEKILHPQKETLQFAAELGEVQDAVKELRQLKEKLTPHDKEDESDDEDEILMIPTNGNPVATVEPMDQSENSIAENESNSSDEDEPEIVTGPLPSTDLTKKVVVEQPSTTLVPTEEIPVIDENEPEILSAPFPTTNSAEKSILKDSSLTSTTSKADPRIIWTEDLDDEDTLAVSDDETPLPKIASDVVVEIEDDAVGPVSQSVMGSNKRSHNNVTIDISDDEDNSDSSTRRSKRNKDVFVDEEATLAGVLATFNDEMNVDFIEL